ncbi:MAG TPA: hypothetical protein VKV27_16760 [Solirubrobacteraceae bacterium]|nr:hypothetical protein [Solirubrobacteraceae bacterium]
MTVHAIVSYDGTPNDDDALALARLLASADVSLALAYVRHAREYDPRREALEAFDAERRLEHGAVWLGDPEIERHVVVDPSTSSGLSRLAAAQQAQLILFGSDYRTPPGHVEPGTSAQGLLEGGSVAIGVACAGLRAEPETRIRAISVHSEPGGTALRTASSLADALDADLVDAHAPADLIVVDSQPHAPSGRIALGGATRGRLDSARGSVIVLPRGVQLGF